MASSKRYRTSESPSKTDQIPVRLNETASKLLRSVAARTNFSLNALVDYAVLHTYSSTLYDATTLTTALDSYAETVAAVQETDVYQDAVARLAGDLQDQARDLRHAVVHDDKET